MTSLSFFFLLFQAALDLCHILLANPVLILYQKVPKSLIAHWLSLIDDRVNMVQQKLAAFRLLSILFL